MLSEGLSMEEMLLFAYLYIIWVPFKEICLITVERDMMA